MSDTVLVLGEFAGDAPLLSTLETLAAARSISPTGDVAVVLGGPNGARCANSLIAHGADRIYVSDGSSEAAESIVASAEEAIRLGSAKYVLGAKTLLGRDVMPRLAWRLGTALASDCSEVSLDSQDRLIVSRPTYGGNANALVACLGNPSVASIRPKSMDPLEPDTGRTGEIVEITAGSVPIQVRSIEIVEQVSDGLKLEDAKVVVAGGRGLGGPEPFAELDRLANLLGGAVGSSRAAVDAGWVPSSYQVGLTGKTVTPDLYIAIGISGASQHMAGCSNSRTLIAINKDAGANIFKDARFGVAGDWEKVLPAFMEQLHELLD